MIATALDAILAMVVIEATALSLYHKRTGQGIAPRSLLPNLAAGFCLTLAARLCLATTSADAAALEYARSTPLAVGATLLAALVAHAFDLADRWRG